MESFLIVLEGGDYPDEYKVSGEQINWPLPELIYADGCTKGVYEKVFQSKGLPSQTKDGMNLRGAKYVWNANRMPFKLAE